MRLMMFKNLCFSSLFYFLTFKLTSIDASNIQVLNNCSYTVWAAAVPGGGGRLLKQGQDWLFNADPNFSNTYRVWARTNCNFEEIGNRRCETGDCNGVLYCVSYGTPPNTMAELKFGGSNDLDFFDISLVDGFNVPMEFSGTSSNCTKVMKCAGDINGLCPTELRHPGGCNHPCTLFKNNQFCCIGGPTSCDPNEAYFKFFKNLCPNVYSYPYDDDATATFTCPTGTDYKVVFCP